MKVEGDGERMEENAHRRYGGVGKGTTGRGDKGYN